MAEAGAHYKKFHAILNSLKSNINGGQKTLPISYKKFNLYEIAFMSFNLDQLITVTFTLFAVIDILGSIPLLVSLKEKMGGIRPLQVTLVSGVLMILFLLAGQQFLQILSLDIHSFAIGGSIVMFLLGLEMVLGTEIFKGDADIKSGTVVLLHFQ